jgi:hypothetical protein
MNKNEKNNRQTPEGINFFMGIYASLTKVTVSARLRTVSQARGHGSQTFGHGSQARVHGSQARVHGSQTLGHGYQMGETRIDYVY